MKLKEIQTFERYLKVRTQKELMRWIFWLYNFQAGTVNDEIALVNQELWNRTFD